MRTDVGGTRRTALILVLAALGALAVLGLQWLSGGKGEPPPARMLSVADTLTGDPAGFERALVPRPFRFPADHGPHEDFRTEWWYFTGNLADGGGRRFGFQLTFFRFALAPDSVPRASAWATRQVYMAHLALTDVAGDEFYSAERFARGALGLAGAQAAPFRVWLEDWSADGGDDQLAPVRLRAAEPEFGIDLRLEPGKPRVLHGEQGLSRKSDEPGNASFYYSFTRMPADGTVRVGPQTWPVQGTAWLDREWSTSALAPDQVGWDWFSVQLSDGRELMFFRLRRPDGNSHGSSAGTLVDAAGGARALGAEAVDVEVLDHWPSPIDGTRYPSRWRLSVPGERLRLEVRPLVADQELNHAFRYWEGAVEVVGEGNGSALTGVGYVEMTGYAPQP